MESVWFGILSTFGCFLLPATTVSSSCLTVFRQRADDQRNRRSSLLLIPIVLLSLIPAAYLIITDTFSYFAMLAVIVPLMLLQYGPLFVLLVWSIALAILKITKAEFSLKKALRLLLISEGAAAVITGLFWLLKTII